MDKQNSKQKRISITSQACSFCKKRHLKCDGRHPCVQCTSRNIECNFEANAKRGRKTTKQRNEESETLVRYNNPAMMWTDQNYHPMFINCYLQSTGYYFPHVTLQSVQFTNEQEVVIANPSLWMKIQNLDAFKSQMTLLELFQSIEYLSICGQGARVSLNSLDAMALFYNRIDTLLHSISFGFLITDPLLAEYAINVLTICYFGYLELHNISHCRFCSFHSLNILTYHSSTVRRDTRNRLYLNLAACCPDMDDKLHYISKVDTEPLTMNTIINLFYGTALIVSSGIGQALDTQNTCIKMISTPQKDRILQEKLLAWLEQSEQFLFGKANHMAFASTTKEAISIATAFKAYLLDKVGNSDMAQVLAKTAVSNMLGLDSRTHLGVGIAILLALSTLKSKEDIALFMPEISKWMGNSRPSPGLQKFLDLIMPARVEELDEKSSPLTATLENSSPQESFTEADIEALLFGVSSTVEL